MVLNSIFSGQTQFIDEDGVAATSGSNLAESSVISGNLETGYIAAIWDYDLTTYLGYDISAVSDKSITFDMLARRQNVVLTVHYSITNSVGTNTASIVVQYSDNNSTWTTSQTLNITGSAQVATGRLSANFSARYIRFLTDVTVRNGTCYTKIFDVKIVKAMS